MFIYGMVLVMYSTLMSDISKDLHLNMVQAGLYFSINFSGFILFVLTGGIFSQKMRKKFIISICLVGTSAALLVFGASTDKFTAFIAIFFMGGFSGTMESMICSLVADLNTIGSEYYINLLYVFICAGAVVGPVMGSITVSSGLGWRVSFYVLSLMLFILFIIFNWSKIKESTIVKKAETSSLKEIIFDKKFFLLCICILIYSGAEVGVWGWMTTFFKENIGLSINISAIIVSSFWISMGLGRVVCGKLTKYFSIETITIALTLISAVAVILSGFAATEISAFIITVVLGLAFSSQFPFLLSIGGKLRSNALAFSLMVVSSGIGVVIFPFLMGIIGDYFNIRIAIMSTSLLFLMTTFLLVFGGNKQYRKYIKNKLSL
jgi:fucose permease